MVGLFGQTAGNVAHRSAKEHGRRGESLDLPCHLDGAIVGVQDMDTVDASFEELLDEGLRDGVYPALVANQVLDEGVDLPEVKIAVVLGGKSSTRQSKQRLGRILRKRGNARAVLYEVVTAETKEVQKSRNRRRNDAYQGTSHRKLRRRPDPS